MAADGATNGDDRVVIVTVPAPGVIASPKSGATPKDCTLPVFAEGSSSPKSIVTAAPATFNAPVSALGPLLGIGATPLSVREPTAGVNA
jgi:hypothetical protein